MLTDIRTLTDTDVRMDLCRSPEGWNPEGSKSRTTKSQRIKIPKGRSPNKIKT